MNHLKISVPCIPLVVNSLVLSHMTASQMENEEWAVILGLEGFAELTLMELTTAGAAASD